MGKATIKFILKRFKNWIPSESSDGQSVYPHHALTMIAIAQEKLDMGILPSQIEKQLEEQIHVLPNTDASSVPETIQNGDIRLSQDGLQLLKSVFNDIGEQQRKIAKAHEKRANAEERKAVAIEKRAVAEEKKAQAMNNIASALQEMNQIRSTLDPTTQQIAHQAVSVIAEDELSFDSPNDINDDHNDDLVDDDIDDLINDDHLDNLASLIDQDDILDDLSFKDDLTEIDEINFDNIEKIVDTDSIPELDDLAELISEDQGIFENELTDDVIEDLDSLSNLIDEPPIIDMQIDDLSKLIDDQPSETGSSSGQLDDLSKLIDAVSGSDDKKTIPDGMDNLSDLLENNSTDIGVSVPVKMDDLSLLIETPDNQIQPQDELDDLSLLIDTNDSLQESGEEISDTHVNDAPAASVPKLDDLSKLIDKKETSTVNGDKREENNPMPKIQLDISPDEDLGKYKAAIMKVIIGLKTDGNDAKITTNILNKNKVKTLSGKPEWTQKAITQIYKFIESAS